MIISIFILLLIAFICLISALLPAGIARLCFFCFSETEKDFHFFDDHSKLCGVIAGVLFALFFVTFILKFHKDCQDKDLEKPSGLPKRKF